MPNESEGISLAAVVNGLLQALKDAKHAGDLESARLAEVYKNEKGLSSFAVPAFAVSDVEVELKCSVLEPPSDAVAKGQPGALKVIVSSDRLKGLEPHQISLLKFKINAVNLRVFEEPEE
ncbi:MAG: hypothetical protein AABZ02_07820 [Bacteroidota bacterium]